MNIESIYFFGGVPEQDKRLRFVMDNLSESFSVKCSFPPKGADAVILPLPTTRDGVNVSGTYPSMALSDTVEYIDSYANGGAVIVAGMAPESFRTECERKSHPCRDMYDSESFAVKNAAITAEGALFSYIKARGGTAKGKKILIFGFGRVAEATADIFASLGAHVTIAARDEAALEKAMVSGYGAVSLYQRDDKLRALGEADVIINTVPARVVSGYELAAIGEGAYIEELASAPYGIDAGEAGMYGLEVVRLPSLPASYAPRDAARIITDEILQIFDSLGG